MFHLQNSVWIIIFSIFFSFEFFLAPALAKEKKPKVVYPAKTKLDFEGSHIEGEINNPGDFYFEHKPQEKMDSLIKRRRDFHKEMLRDVVLSK